MEIKDIQDYVRHTPCNTNPAVLGSMIKELGNSGGGLPDPSTLSNGTAMVAVNGEWKMQEGYGYTVEPAFEPITWDGNTEGRESIYGSSYKVSDYVPTIEEVTGASWTVHTSNDDVSGIVSSDNINAPIPGVFTAIFSVRETRVGAYFIASDMEVEGITLHKGTYFDLIPVRGMYFACLAAQSTHQFDEDLIPDKPAKSLLHETLGEFVDIEDGRIRLYNKYDSNTVDIMNNYVVISDDDRHITLKEGVVTVTSPTDDGKGNAINIGGSDDDGNPYIVFSRGDVDCKLTIDVTDSSNPKLLFNGKELAFVTT